MRIAQWQWNPGRGWSPHAPAALPGGTHVVFVFGSRTALSAGALHELRSLCPGAAIIGCSTAGEICGVTVRDDSLTATAVGFDGTRVAGSLVNIASSADSHAAGRRLAESLDHDGLKHVLVFSEGLRVNGSALVAGLSEHLPEGVSVTGGLSADGDRFAETCVVWEGRTAVHAVVGLGLYGESLRVGCGSLGGWDPFGPERVVTRSEGNVLYELDGRSALDLYKTYLGEHADQLPSSGLLFPLCLRVSGRPDAVVRTILSVDPLERSITLAGDIPKGTHARLMKANFDRLIDGAGGAARACRPGPQEPGVELALLISCVGRKLLLKQRIEEEVESVREVLGPQAVLAGFYSYGEISPFTLHANCELHNQTMTITTLSER
jgi:hypothetical protein